jgi:hypothetical protein
MQNAALLATGVAAVAMLALPVRAFTPIPAGAGMPVKGLLPTSGARPARERAACAGRTCVYLRESDEESSGDLFTGGNELALRIMIEKNRVARETADRAYIPMDVAVKWARRLKLWANMEEWEEWIEANKHSNPFIPPNPEEYYTARGVWLGWRYWLGDFE